MSDVDHSARATITVDLDAIRHNVRTLAAAVAPAAMMTVVKADGYGHGMLEVARAAREAGADWLGVAVLEEALALRADGDTGRVLTWLTVPGEDLAAAVAADVDVTAYTRAEVGEVCDAARATGLTARLQLKVDTGLTRGGSTREAWPDLVAEAAHAERAGLVRVTGVWSHLACSDEPDHPANAAQAAAFDDALAVAATAGLRPEVRHLANSAGALLHPHLRHDLVRCGIASYGLSPAPDIATAADLGLAEAMTVTARLAVVKPAAAGSGVSYGHTHVLDDDAVVGVLPVGYGDGVPRHGSSAAPVQVGGERRTVLGRVCMDQLVLDVTGLDVVVGDEAVLFGPTADGVPSAQDWAEACGTISYEIVTRIGGRMARRWTGRTVEADA